MFLAKLFIAGGRWFGLLAFFALLGAWITQVTGRPLFGMSQEHLFNDAIVMSLFCIAGLLDGIVHSKQM